MKQSKKVLALFLILCILIGSIPTVFATENSTAMPAINDTFNDMSVGQEPQGWTVEPVGRTDASVKVISAPKKEQGDYAMRIVDNSSEYQNPTIAQKSFFMQSNFIPCTIKKMSQKTQLNLIYINNI